MYSINFLQCKVCNQTSLFEFQKYLIITHGTLTYYLVKLSRIKVTKICLTKIVSNETGGGRGLNNFIFSVQDSKDSGKILKIAEILERY